MKYMYCLSLIRMMFIVSILFLANLGAAKIEYNGVTLDMRLIELPRGTLIKKGESVSFPAIDDSSLNNAFRAMIADQFPQAFSYDEWHTLVDPANYSQEITGDFFHKLRQVSVRIQSERTVFNFCIRVGFKGRELYIFPIVLEDPHGETRSMSVIEHKTTGFFPIDIFEYAWLVPLGTAKTADLRLMGHYGAVFDAAKKKFLILSPEHIEKQLNEIKKISPVQR